MRVRFNVHVGIETVWAFDQNMPVLPRTGEFLSLDEDVSPLPESELGMREEPGKFRVSSVGYAVSPDGSEWRPVISMERV